MFKTKRVLVVAGVVLLSMSVVSCGGSSGGDTKQDDTQVVVGGTPISGKVSAPGGMIAKFTEKSAFDVALNFFVSPLHAAITGLQPVTGATVELIRVNASGNQVGEVLARTSTSITGDYKLNVPAGVDLSGDLIVRISGTGGAEMRAQVVEKAVDISPVSEFVLRKFINKGTDLSELTTASVIQLSGQVEEFDLSATADLSTMLAGLEDEVGQFVDSKIDLIEQSAGDVALISGDYRVSSFEYGLHDNDFGDSVTVSIDAWNIENLSIAELVDDANNALVTLASEESAWSNMTYSNSFNSLDHHVEVHATETFNASFSGAGVIVIEEPFEENIDGDFGWRELPSISNFYRDRTRDLYFSSSKSASVRYATIDTDGNESKDAIDPNARAGDEVFRGLEVIAKKPSGITPADLAGTYGRIYIESNLHSSGAMSIETERNVITTSIMDNGGEDVLVFNSPTGVNDRSILSRDNKISNFSYAEESTDPTVNVPLEVTADGDVVFTGLASSDGFVNAELDFVMFNENTSVDDANALDDKVSSTTYSTTLAVKLPSTQLSMANKSYRLLSIDVGLSGSVVALSTFNNNTVLSVNANGTSGTLALTGRNTVDIASSLSQVTAEHDDSKDLPVTIALTAAGYLTISAVDGTQQIFLEGYMIAGGGLAVLRNERAEDIVADPSELGVSILMEQGSISFD